MFCIFFCVFLNEQQQKKKKKKLLKFIFQMKINSFKLCCCCFQCLCGFNSPILILFTLHTAKFSLIPPLFLVCGSLMKLIIKLNLEFIHPLNESMKVPFFRTQFFFIVSSSQWPVNVANVSLLVANFPFF